MSGDAHFPTDKYFHVLMKREVLVQAFYAKQISKT